MPSPTLDIKQIIVATTECSKEVWVVTLDREKVGEIRSFVDRFGTIVVYECWRAPIPVPLNLFYVEEYGNSSEALAAAKKYMKGFFSS